MGKIVEGAMIGGSFLPEEQFKDIIKEYFDNSQNVLKIKSILITILQHKDNPRIIYNNIEKLQNELFKNPVTSLLLITNYESPIGNYNWYLKAKEGKVVTDSGILSYAETIKNSILEEEYTRILSDHLLNLIKIIETTHLSKSEIDDYFNKYTFRSSKIKEKMGKRAHDNGDLMNIVYGELEPDKRRGQIADAFVNHLGNMHRALFTQGLETITPFTQTVEEEEGPHFLQLLIDSTNSVGWWTGGDLILVSGNKVIANIQLKTILKNKKGSVGSITTDDILKKVQKLRDFIEKDLVYNKEVFANIMYNTFKTSAIFDKVSKQTFEDGVKIVRQELGLTN